MFALSRIWAAALAVAATQPMLAVQPVAAETLAADHAVVAESPVSAPESGPHARYFHLSSTGSLERVLVVSAARLGAARLALQSLSEHSLQQMPSPSMLQELPLVGSLRRRAGERWNMTDSSRPSDFALCYRVSRVMGLQVIPGDLTPSKLPTPKMLSVKNQGSGMGVLVGMTFRLGRTR